MSQKKAKCTLELRHQRSCDVCFDWGVTVDDPEALIDSFLKDFPNKIWSKNEIASSQLINNDGIHRSNQFKPNNYIYKMIETMLPKARADDGT